MKNTKISIAFFFLISSTSTATTLSEALVNTYKTNPELIAAREKLRVVDEEMYKAISGFLPTIEYSTQKRYDKSSGPDSANALIHSKTKQSSIKLQQNVFNGGKSVMAIQIAKYNVEAARSNLLSIEQNIFLQTIKAYFNVIQNEQILKINKKNVKFYEQKFEVVKQAVDAGIKRRSDLAEAEAAKADAYTRLINATRNFEEALATYIKIVGIPAANLILGQNLTLIPADQIEFLRNALKNNPDLLKVTFQQKAADITLTFNAAGFLPSIDIGGSIDKNWNQTTGEAARSYTHSKSVYFIVNVPIYQKGIEYSNVRVASAEASNLKYVVRNTKASITQDVTQAWSRYIAAKEAIKSAEKAVKAGQIALDGTQQEYQAGVNSLTNLLNAQEKFFQYQLSLAQSIQDYEISCYSMAVVAGKLNVKDLALPTKIYNMSANYDKIKLKLVGF